MIVQIDKTYIKQLVTASAALNSALTQILTSLEDDRWVPPVQAEAELGINAQTVRHLARSGQVASRRLSERRIEVKILDLQQRA